MKVRKAELKDKKDILAIVDLLYLDIPDFVWNTNEFVTRQIVKGDYFLVEDREQTVGVVSFRQRQNRMYVATLAIAKSHQLAGVGTKLIEFAKHFTKERKLDTLYACAFYEYKNKDFYLNKGFSLLDSPGSYNNHKYHRFEMKI